MLANGPNVPDHEIDEELGELKEFFPSGYTQLIYTTFKHGYGRTIADLMRLVYLSNGPIKPVIVEGLISTSLYNCENNYCYIIHSQNLLNMGFQMKDLKYIANELRFPLNIPNTGKWSDILKLIFYSFREREMTIQNLQLVRAMLNEEEYQHLSAILSLIYFLEFLISVYRKEIDYAIEPLFHEKSGDLSVTVADLIKFFQEGKKDIRPVFVLCSFCKDLKDTNGNWHQIETYFAELPANAVFSHSICEKCLKKEYGMEKPPNL